MKFSKDIISGIKLAFRNKKRLLRREGLWILNLDLSQNGDYYFAWWVSGESPVTCSGNLENFPERMLVDAIDLVDLWLMPARESWLEYATARIARERAILKEDKETLERIYKLNKTAK